jgi:hypothetical protein
MILYNVNDKIKVILNFLKLSNEERYNYKRKQS